MKYIKSIDENFGAIDLTYPSQRRVTPMQTEPHPHIINTTGSNQIPKHWNSSPFMVGNSYATGYAWFGKGPKKETTYKKKVLSFEDFIKPSKEASTV